jgi:hypothetical protein
LTESPAAAAARNWEGTFEQVFRTRIITTRQGEEISAGGGGRQAPQMDRGATGGPVVGRGPKGVDSVECLLAPGEHIWTAAEVDAVGGHGEMAAMRASALAGGAQSYTAGAQGGMLMRPACSTTTTTVIEHRVTFADVGGELGLLVLKAMRTQPGLTSEMKQRLGLSIS